MDFQFEKHFTLEEANALIPHIQRLFAEVLALLRQDDSNTPAPRLHSLSSTGNGNGNGSNGNGNGNGNGHGETSDAHYSTWSIEKRREAAYRLLNALQQQGIVIQDVERGLIDFPAILEGKEVFLCYELNDGQSIGYFHEIDAGFAGRQEITGELS